jgi:hypothetical protein
MRESAADLQREAESARAGLSNTLDELRSSLTTAAIGSGAMTIAREGSATLARVAVERARANPLAALLIGTGVVLLLNHDKRDGAGRLVQRVVRTVTDTARGAASAAGGMAEDTVHTARKASRHIADQARGAVEEATDQVEDAAAHAAGRARRATSEGMDKARDVAVDLQGRASRLIDDNRRYLTPAGMVRLAHEHPILVAALGVAVGAAIGAALPPGKADGRHLASTDGESADNCAQPDGRT